MLRPLVTVTLVMVASAQLSASSAPSWDLVFPAAGQSVTLRAYPILVANASNVVALGGDSGTTPSTQLNALQYSITSNSILGEFPTGGLSSTFLADRAASAVIDVPALAGTSADVQVAAFGGVNAAGVETNTFATYNPAINNWTAISTVSAVPAARQGAALAYLNNAYMGVSGFILFGGSQAGSLLSDTNVYLITPPSLSTPTCFASGYTGVYTTPTIGCPANQVISEITFASYGWSNTATCGSYSYTTTSPGPSSSCPTTTTSCQAPGVLETVEESCLGLNTCYIDLGTSGQWNGVDPCLDCYKQMAIQALCAPMPATTECAVTVWGSVAPAVVTCPPNQVVTGISYAAYGWSNTATCGSFAATTTGAGPSGCTATSCQASGVQATVEEACLGLNTCSVAPASNGQWNGVDPCHGCYKQMVIQAECSPALGWTSLSYSSGTPPSARSQTSLVPSSDGRFAYLFGGQTAGGASNDMYMLSTYSGFDNPQPSELVNIAVGKWAAQSSVQGAGNPSLAVSGTINTAFTAGSTTQCTQTTCTGASPCTPSSTGTTAPWWYVDLGTIVPIQAITLYQRTDCSGSSCWQGYMQGYQVWVGTENSTSPSAAGNVQCPSYSPDILGPSVYIACPATARYVWVTLPGSNRILTLCQVQVWQKTTWAWRQLSGTAIVSQGAIATQSSTYSSTAAYTNAIASRAVDGITSNAFATPPYTCSMTAVNTNNPQPSWWMVDLGAVYDVTSIAVWPRTDWTVAPAFSDQNTRWNIYVGNSQDWTYDTQCPGVPTTMTPPTTGTNTVISCVATGRYVIVTRTYLAGDDNIIAICELQVTANKQLNQPSARSGHAAIAFRGGMLVYGGTDVNGIRLGDLQFYDFTQQAWQQALAPLSTAPVARANAGLVAISANSVAMFGGQSSAALSDFNLLTFPSCPAFNGQGISAQYCTRGGSQCTFTCNSGFTNQNVNSSGYAIPLICGYQGNWIGATPPCLGSSVANAPSNVNAALGSNNSVTVSWTPLTNGGQGTGSYSNVLGYQVSTYFPTFNVSFPPGVGPSDFDTEWYFFNLNSVAFGVPNGYGQFGSFMQIESPPNGNCWVGSWQCPVVYRNWPSSVPNTGSWYIEGMVVLDNLNYPAQINTISGIGIFDVGSGFSYPIMYAGIMYNGLISGTSQPQFDAIFESAQDYFTNTAALSTTNNFPLSAVWMRIHRIYPNQWQAFWKWNSTDMSWTPINGQSASSGNVGIVTDTVNGHTLFSAMANLRPAFVGKNWSGSYPALHYLNYLKVGTLAPLGFSNGQSYTGGAATQPYFQQASAGTVVTTGPSATSATITGLTPGAAYTLQVQAITTAGLGAPGQTSSVTVPAANWASSFTGWTAQYYLPAFTGCSGCSCTAPSTNPSTWGSVVATQTGITVIQLNNDGWASASNSGMWNPPCSQLLGCITFGAVISGTFFVPTTSTYTFQAAPDDGVIVIVDSTQIIESWKTQGITSYTGSILLTAGIHTVQIYYYQGECGWGLWFGWNNYGSTSSFNYDGTGVYGTSWANVALQKPSISYGAWCSGGGCGTANYGNDGILVAPGDEATPPNCVDTSVSSGASNGDPWWSVDLGQSTDIQHMIVYWRGNTGWEYRGQGLYFYVGDSPMWQMNTVCPGVWTTWTVAGLWYQGFDCLLTGRYITILMPWIDSLNFCEFQAYAPTTATCPNRLALTTNAIQSSSTGTCTAATYGTQCVMACAAPYEQIGGSTTATCRSLTWDSPPLVCGLTCPTLSMGAGYGSCGQSLFQENFSNATAATARFFSLEANKPLGPANNAIWMATTGSMQFMALPGSPLTDGHLVAAASSVYSNQGAFTYSATVQASTSAGLIFMATNINNFYRFVINTQTGVHFVERTFSSNVTTLITATVQLNSAATYLLSVSYSAGQINCSINGTQIMYTYDRDLQNGYAGFYAYTQASFSNVMYAVGCSSGCAGTTPGQSCQYACQPGMLTLNTTSNGTLTCTLSSDGTTASWVGAQPTCTMPAPVFYGGNVSVAENAPVNTLVGAPLVATVQNPTSQVLFTIIAGNNGTLPPFTIDACSGQIKILNAGVLNVATGPSLYVLTVQAYVVGYQATAFTNALVYVTIIPVPEPPVINQTTLYVPELSAANTHVGTVTYTAHLPFTAGVAYSWTDNAGGLFALNPTSGVVTVANSSGVSAQLTYPRTWNQLAKITPNAYPTLFSTGTVVIALTEVNVPPIVSPAGQQLLISEVDAVDGAIVGTVGTYKANDAYSGSAFASNITVKVVTGTAATTYCPVNTTSNPNLLYGTVNGLAGGASYFAAYPNSTLYMQNVAAGDPWHANNYFIYASTYARAVYSVCLNVTDRFGAWTAGSVQVVIVANLPELATITAMAAPSTLNTLGNQTVNFTVQNVISDAVPTATIIAWYTSPATGGSVVKALNATNCGLVPNTTGTQIQCTTVAGVGAGWTWTVYVTAGLTLGPIVATVPLVTSYAPPAVAAINNAGSLPTATQSIIQFVGSGFGPGTADIPAITYGPSETDLIYTCSVIKPFTDSSLSCYSQAPGSGADLEWSLTVAGQTVTTSSSGSGSGAPTISYAPPSITSITVTGDVITAMGTAGGATVNVNGMNFGEPTANVSMQMAVGMNVYVALSGCQQASPTLITCTSAAGVGTNLPLMVTVSGQSSQLTNGSAAAGQGLSYRPPVITGTSGQGALASPTQGGAQVIISGLNFGPTSYPVAVITSVLYGHPSSVNLNPTSSCTITQSQTTIQCLTVPGTGANLTWVVDIGSQASNYFADGSSYAPPIVTGFSTSAPSIDTIPTVGGSSITITGQNFGPVGSPLFVSYGVAIKDGVVTDVNFTAAACSVSTANTGITCYSVAGAGANLVWSVVVDGQASSEPTTSYAPPVITSITNVNGSTIMAANVNGGDKVYVSGSGFGPPTYNVSSSDEVMGLVQTLTFGMTGAEYSIPRSSFDVMSDSLIVATLPPGCGSNLVMQVQVADQYSAVSTASFSYALPSILLMSPSSDPVTAPNAQPPAVTLTVSNLPLLDTLSAVSVYFGLAPNRVLITPTLPAGSAATSTANISFSLPSNGLGQFLPVQVVVQPVGYVGTATVTAVSNITSATLFSYAPPVIIGISVTAARFVTSPSPSPSALPSSSASASPATATSSPIVTPSGSTPTASAVPSASSVNATATPSAAVTPTASFNSSTNGTGHRLLQSTPSPAPSTTASPSPSPSSAASSGGGGDSLSIVCPFPQGDPNWNCADPTVLMMVITGTSFGNFPSISSTVFGTTASLTELLSYVPPAAETWSSSILYVYSWTTTEIVAFTHTNVTFDTPTLPTSLHEVQVSLTSTGYYGPATIYSAYNYSTLSPSISALTSSLTNYPTIGGGQLTLTVTQLDGMYKVSITVGGVLTTLIDASGATLSCPALLSNFATSSVAGINYWTITVVVPPGQGAGQPIVVTAIALDGATTSSDPGWTIDYAPPQLSFIQLLPLGASSLGPVTTSGEVSCPSSCTVTSNTQGQIVRVYGTNLGTAPQVVVGDGYVYTYQAGNGTLTSGVLQACPNTGSTQSCYQFLGPPGEGDGLQPACGSTYVSTDGFTLQLSAGGQADGSTVAWRYAAPSVTKITSSSSLGFPTQGGVTLSIYGSNFGYPLAGGCSDSPVNVSFALNGFILTCANVTRVNQTLLTCVLPPGSGADLSANITVADVTGTTAGVLSYNPPVIYVAYASSTFNVTAPVGMNMSSNGTHNVSSTPFVSPFGPSNTTVFGFPIYSAPQTPVTLSSNTTGGMYIVVSGRDFGASSAPAHCAFTEWANYNPSSGPVDCDGMEDFLGEGEIPSGNIVFWNDTTIVFRTQPGLGVKFLQLSVNGQTLGAPTQAAPWYLIYNPPVLQSISPATAGTDGGAPLTVLGSNFGPALPLPGGLTASSFPVSLSEAYTLPMAYLVINFESTCISNATYILTGAIPSDASACVRTIQSTSQTSLIFAAPAGVGVDLNVTVEVYDENYAVQGATAYPYQGTSNTVHFSYDPPTIDIVTPNVLEMDDGSANLPFKVEGINFGVPSNTWTAAEKVLAVSIGNFTLDSPTWSPGVGTDAAGNSYGLINAIVNSSVTVGFHGVTVHVAGQVASVPSSSGVEVGCMYGYYGTVGETCDACPSVGATCPGLQIQANTSDYAARYPYPIPTAGFYNLNGSMASACPAGFMVPDRLEDVCIVACATASACLGDNYCAVGYTSTAPLYRCGTCASGYYPSANSCLKCPNSPAALFIGMGLVLIAAAAIGYFLNKSNINIAFISIGIDYFQVLSMFANAKIVWPTVVQQLFQVMSAFNLNIQVVAPECLIPNVSFEDKFAFIMLLPLLLGLIFFIVGSAEACYKYCVLGRKKNNLMRHVGGLTSIFLILFYVLYLYLTETIISAFNCAPTDPPDGHKYLQAVFVECGVPGGTQMQVLPWAIIAFIVYTAGYPAFVAQLLWRNRERVMEDQLLRAKGTGRDRLTNPHAYDLRRRFGRTYYQFKPDYCMWILLIIARKFLIAICSLVFNENSAFQMSACLLVLFVAYSLQVRFSPYMAPGDYEAVIKSHELSSYTSAIHARLRTTLAGVESRGKKRVHRNLLNYEGKIDRSAILGVLAGWWFNYNTMEATLLFCGIIVCLCAVMYEAVEGSVYYNANGITVIVMIVMIFGVVYFCLCFITEVYILATESSRRKQLEKKRRDKKLNGLGKKLGSDADSEKEGRAAVTHETYNTGPMETRVNPLFITGPGAPATGTGDLEMADKALESMQQFQDAPPTEMWHLFKTNYGEILKQYKDMKAALQATKQDAQKAQTAAEAIPANPIAKRRSTFAPTLTSDVSAVSDRQALNPLAMPGSARGMGNASMRGRVGAGSMTAGSSNSMSLAGLAPKRRTNLVVDDAAQ